MACDIQDLIAQMASDYLDQSVDILGPLLYYLPRSSIWQGLREMVRNATLTMLLLLLVVAVIGCTGQSEAKASATPLPVSPSPSATATSTPSPLSSPTATLAPTASPTPTSTPKPSPTTTPAASTHLPGGPQAVNVVRGDLSKAQVALTFDAGSGAEGTPAILAVLREHQVRSTFFLTGAWVERYPDLARKIVSDGHELGNHSFSHPNLTEVGDEAIASELTRTEALLKKVAGVGARPLFRLPFGAYDARVLRVLRDLGYVSVYWTLDSTDWRDESTARGIAQLVLEKTGNGFIVVHHASPVKTAEALKTIVPGLKSRGFSLVPVSKLLSN